MKSREICIFLLSLITAATISADCGSSGYRNHIGTIQYIEFYSGAGTVVHRDQSKDEFLKHLHRNDIKIREYCIGYFGELGKMLASANFPKESYSHVLFYTGMPLAEPFWGFNSACYSVIGKEISHEK